MTPHTPPLPASEATLEVTASQLAPPPLTAQKAHPSLQRLRVLATTGVPFPSSQACGAVQCQGEQWMALATGALTRPLRLADGQVAL